MVVFTIHDSGPGIPIENLDRVFDCFFSIKTDGMDVGLAVCQSIITAHGASISVSNHPDSGAVFSFSIPGLAIESPPPISGCPREQRGRR
jgi:two-component system, LuxR family, sensor kinase FixL